MKIVEKIESLKKVLKGCKDIGFIPTMGALHSGHIELVRRAKRECKMVVVSVFVNPTQFNDKEDLQRYPRNLEKDARLLEEIGADLLFAPSEKEIYPNHTNFTITEPQLLTLTNIMEGAHRPGHFDGVVQVVGKLFDIVTPHKAYFGLKDFQQLVIIQMATKLQGRRVEIIPCEIIRDSDGLALSSRNTLLSPKERTQAPNIYKTLQQVRQQIDSSNESFEAIKNRAILEINKNTYLCTEYLEIVDYSTLQPVVKRNAKIRVCVAVRCKGGVRLIDNI